MSNPLNNMNPQLMNGMNQIKNMMSQLRMARNPNLMMQQLAQSNPQFAQVMQMCGTQNPKDVFYSMCSQRGIDPNEIIRNLQN